MDHYERKYKLELKIKLTETLDKLSNWRAIEHGDCQLVQGTAQAIEDLISHIDDILCDLEQSRETGSD